ncbi:hypothetical protein C8F04DRAFT_1255488 [Mycena alexandri]|uniref:Uncharacterized protein n=1 Tax=Mycena alexandri TaxID=1745969 RepID=A0AAD6T6Y7_9AGAR|nr:hypothetical protein C8F04DRAFT_1255488 [Mycena alexandri]
MRAVSSGCQLTRAAPRSPQQQQQGRRRNKTQQAEGRDGAEEEGRRKREANGSDCPNLDGHIRSERAKTIRTVRVWTSDYDHNTIQLRPPRFDHNCVERPPTCTRPPSLTPIHTLQYRAPPASSLPPPPFPFLLPLFPSSSPSSPSSPTLLLRILVPRFGGTVWRRSPRAPPNPTPASNALATPHVKHLLLPTPVLPPSFYSTLARPLALTPSPPQAPRLAEPFDFETSARTSSRYDPP